MPLPLILGAAAAAAGLVGESSAVYGSVKMKEENDTIKDADREYESNTSRFEKQNK